MNVEKLNAVIGLVLNDFKENKAITYLQQVLTSSTNIMNQPNQPSHQANLAKQLDQFIKAAEESPTNKFSPSYLEVLKEIGVYEFVGNQLKSTVEGIFSRNTITIAIANKELTDIVNDLLLISQNIENANKGLTSLGIKEEEIPIDKCDISIMIPRSYIDNEYSGLVKEFREIEFILVSFSRLVAKDQEEFKLKTLSTTDPVVVIETIIPVGAVVAGAISWIIDQYKKVVEIQEIKQRMKNVGMNPEQMKETEAFSEEFMLKAIDIYADKLFEQYPIEKNDGEEHEVANRVRLSLNKIANRVDGGFSFDVTVAINEGSEEHEEKNNVNSIKESQETMEYVNKSSETIISLPEEGANTKV